MSERVPPIRSELLAAKIQKLRNFELPELFDEFAEEPRLIRALWFLEFVSKPDNYAGGLTKFSEDFIADCADKIGTPTMVKLGPVTSYRIADATAILRELKQYHRAEILGKDAWIFENQDALDHKTGKAERVTFERVIESWGDDREEDDLQSWTGSRSELHRLLLAKLTSTTLREWCVNDVSEVLALYFRELCELPHIGFRPNANGNGPPKYFSEVGSALLSFIDKRADTLRATLAETEVTRLVFRWMSKAREMNEPVMISGNSRFGKTEAVKLLCDMQPGNFRMVNTPASNAISDLFREVARSLGIEVGPQNNLRELRERIEFVLRFSRLVLCFDEFQFALPASYSRNTAQARLNWLRRAIIDQKLPAVFICTPQNYFPAKKRFVKATQTE